MAAADVRFEGRAGTVGGAEEDEAPGGVGCGGAAVVEEFGRGAAEGTRQAG